MACDRVASDTAEQIARNNRRIDVRVPHDENANCLRKRHRVERTVICSAMRKLEHVQAFRAFEPAAWAASSSACMQGTAIHPEDCHRRGVLEGFAVDLGVRVGKVDHARRVAQWRERPPPHGRVVREVEVLDQRQRRYADARQCVPGHIEVRQLWILYKVRRGDIKVGKVRTHENVADALTNYVSRDITNMHMMSSSRQ